jgi:hypothetical protein
MNAELDGDLLLHLASRSYQTVDATAEFTQAQSLHETIGETPHQHLLRQEPGRYHPEDAIPLHRGSPMLGLLD